MNSVLVYDEANKHSSVHRSDQIKFGRLAQEEKPLQSDLYRRYLNK